MAEPPRIIDTHMHGRHGLTACYLIAGERVALVETGPKSSVDHVIAGLDAAGVDDLDWIVVTHIHLDHAGAAGTLSARWPNARVAVHEVGAPHLVDPGKLWKSASRIYGDRMEALWGGVDPVPPDRIEILADGDVVDLGGRRLTAFDTPGHAFHHHVLLDDATGLLFTGDALGVRLPDVGLVRPATPPPEFHLEKAIASINHIVELEPAELWLTHFGPQHAGRDPRDVNGTCVAAIDALNQWAEWARVARERTSDLDDATKLIEERARAALEGALDDEAIERLEQTTSYRMNASGYMRYLDKHEPLNPS